MYNYQKHVIEKEKATAAKNVLQGFVATLLILILFICVTFLLYRNSSKNEIIRLHHAIDNVNNQLHQQKIIASESFLSSFEQSVKSNTINLAEAKETPGKLREELRQKLLALYESESGEKQNNEIQDKIKNTNTYIKLKTLINEKSGLSESDPFWKEIESLVLAISPQFKQNLKLLAGGKFSSYDLDTALLIKLGVKPAQMAILFNRSKGAIVSRRDSLCERIFDKHLGTQTLDGIIRLL